MTRFTHRVAPFFLFSAMTLAVGCAVAPPTSPSDMGSGLSGKADGATACSEAEIGFLSCAQEHCSVDETYECLEVNCGDVRADIGRQCTECVNSHDGDLEIAVDRCATAPAPAGPCADDAALIECAVTNCEGLGGDPLFECIGNRCDAESTDIPRACGECILIAGQAGTEALSTCSDPGSSELCNAEETDALTTCSAENCGALEGDDYNTCLTSTCEAEIRALNPVCLQCVGNGLDAGSGLDETVASCRGTDAPAPTEGAAVCTYEEMADILTCGETHCGGSTGDVFNECLDANCSDVLEAAAGNLSDPCATCFIYTVEGGATMAETRAACVAPAES
ncbi:MAG: hypothetical protein DRJ42_24150 [Deltaproteobacteria bacterium]|nr:MAG: hypothetical protein DRJ42_24150 [Deltaproteobacteria bacterium]